MTEHDALVNLRVIISERRYHANMSVAMKLHHTAEEQFKEVKVLEIAADALAKQIALQIDKKI